MVNDDGAYLNIINNKNYNFECLNYSDDEKIIFFSDTLQIYVVKNCMAELLCNLKKEYEHNNNENENVLRNKRMKNDSNSSNNDELNQIKKIFLHVSHDCNLNCGYCYAGGGAYGKNKELMSIETAEKTIDYVINRFAKVEELGIEFFGGEPMLNYKMIGKLINNIEKRYPEVTFSYGCVTNGTIMNEEIYNMYKKYRFHVMLTIDGPQKYHDKQRIDKEGKGTFDTIVMNLPLFKQSVEKLSVRVVYTKKNVDLFQIYKYIYEKLEITDISFRPVMTRSQEYALDKIDKEFIEKEICKIFDYYFEKKLQGEQIHTKLFDEIIFHLLNKQQKTNFCDFGRFVSITPNGNIYPCTHFVYNEDYNMGNIYKTTINQKIMNLCIKSSVPDYSPCNNCWVVGLCGGGCKGSAIFYEHSLFSNDEFCDVRKRLISHVIVKIVQLYKKGEIEKFEDVLVLQKSEGEVSPNRWR
ncbi:radical SAM protein [Eubacterium sp.]